MLEEYFEFLIKLGFDDEDLIKIISQGIAKMIIFDWIWEYLYMPILRINGNKGFERIILEMFNIHAEKIDI